jgi:RNA polymerase sigma-70 factor (ECF subfamily)
MTDLERELIESIKKGNPKSFELVFKTYYKKLCTFAFDYTRQLETAEDIVKDFFVAFWENRKTIEIKTSLSGYLFRSVRNACINYLLRNKERNNTISMEEVNWIEIKINEPVSNDYPIGNLLAKELEGQIYNIIEKLPETCREIFKLSRFDDLSHKKIAERLHISENTVKVQIYRALKHLKEAISVIAILLFKFFS